jgi:uncharacterized protein DUF2851
MGTDRRPEARSRPREAELIARWGAGVWRGRTLRAADGAAYTVIYQGRPGGSAGPDFRDAVLRAGDGARVTGDIELHLSPAGWRAHGHATDPRYNQVALHVTLRAGAGADAAGTILASGRRAPLVALAAQSMSLNSPATPPPWPCAPQVDEAGPGPRRSAPLRRVGWERLRERASALAVARARVALSVAGGLWDGADRALFIAIAEALGYGRDRDALRRCGERLASGAEPDALYAEAARLGVVERRRVAGLVALRTRWLAAGPLATLRGALALGAARAGAIGAGRALVEELAAPGKGVVSRGRARIISINVALPFLLLDARDASDGTRWELAVTAIERFPSLPSNQITRVMAAQLGLPRAPAGALAQQGLHHVWERHCREKRCAGCPCALRASPGAPAP